MPAHYFYFHLPSVHMTQVNAELGIRLRMKAEAHSVYFELSDTQGRKRLGRSLSLDRDHRFKVGSLQVRIQVDRRDRTLHVHIEK